MTRTQAFSHWLKEFLLNVFMQSFHAVTYAVVVQAGITAFSSNGNWLFLVICVTFLFQGERILRKIFNMGSSFGTLKDLGETGLAAWGATKALTSSFHGKKNDNEATDNEEKDNESDESSQSTIGAPTPGTVRNNQSIGINPQMSALSAVQNIINKNAKDIRNSTGRKFASGLTNMAGGLYGGMLATTASLAGGKDASQVALSGVAGFTTGRGIIGGIAGHTINGISNAFAGRNYKKAILRGDMDAQFKNSGLDLDKIERDIDKNTADLIRKALAEQQSAAIRRGEKVGTYKFYKTINKNK